MSGNTTRTMNQRTRTKLIVGIALMIFGPVIGWVLTIAGFFHTATSMQQSILRTPPGTIPDFGQTFGQTGSQMFFSLIPMLVGAVCGAAGLFIVLYSFITHLLPAKGDSPRQG
ncbi:MAG: hypothetical protein HY301_07335 [Verrucomicrobia bacterium]|nr:hypothetical protein [Verrucomicrobiota bacterium]